MADYEALHNAIRARVKTLVEDAVPIATMYDNGLPFGDPDSIYAVPDPQNDSWLRAAIQPAVARVVESDGDVAGVMTNTYRTDGILLLSFYGPLEKGDGGLLETIDVAVLAFRGQHTTDFSFLVPTPSRGRRDGDWWRIDVSCPFFADEQA